MSTPASIKRHPIHPMLVAIPIGLWVFSIVADLIRLSGRGSPVWGDVAFYTIIGGIVGALLAAVPGFIDFRSISDPAVGRIAQNHMLINVAAVVVFAVSVWMRIGDAWPHLAVAVSVLGILMVAVSGWLGGEMVYVRGMGVSTEPERRASETRRRVA